jgi:acyl-CoA reductase-like NAD-dependent aldehyde dehydrogenase
MTNEIEVLSPYDNSVVAKVLRSSPEDVERAFLQAEKGFELMKQTSAFERSKILERAAELIESRKEEFAQILVKEAGKTIREGRAEASRCVETVRGSAEEAKRIYGETVPVDAAPGVHKKIGFYKRVPVGIVVAISPFNFPLNLLAHKIAPALAAGCSVVAKPATKTPLSGLKLAEALWAAGLPKEALSVVVGLGSEIGDLIVKDPRPRMITFTGSRDVGLDITAKAGMKKITMELGSNSACVIFNDGDLERAAEKIKVGGYALAGQVCISVQRVYVQEKAFDEFLRLLIPKVEGIRVGNPALDTTDMGPMISRSALEKVVEWIDEAKQRGGKLVTGGKTEGNFLYPTVLAEVPEYAKLIKEEAFAPLVVVNRFKDLDDAVAKVNATQYGLQAGVFTSDMKTGIECAERIDCGGVLINEIPNFRVDLMPYGGMKYSGMGREGPKFAVEEMTELKLIIFDYS